jgi:crossover junction endodeoxyribonuclease RuvC
MSEIAVAIDPGALGGLAWQVPGFAVAVENMPETPHELCELLTCIQKDGDVRVFLEEVGGYVGGAGAPGSAMFSFGQNYGQILGVCAALGIPVELVRPQRWQKALSLGTSKGLTKSQWKGKLKLKALQLYPDVRVTLNVADALLIHHAAVKGLI